MKNLIILFLSVAFLISCDTDPCKDVVCGIAGTCTEGLCVCDTGYETDSIGACNIEWSAKFLGTNVAAEDTCVGQNNGTFNYAMTLSRKSEIALTTTNFAGYGPTNVVEMDVTSASDISINYTDVANRVFTGSGSISGGVITLDVTVAFPGSAVGDTCTTVITL